MKRHWITGITAVAAILALPACATKGEQPSAGDLVDLGLVVGGKLIDEVLSDPDEANRILLRVFGNEFASDSGRAVLKEALEALDRGVSPETDIPALRGIGGFSVAELAQRVLFPKVKRETKGLIGDYLVLFDEDRKKGYGHLTVDMKTEIFLTAESYRNRRADRTVLRQWHIDVVKDTKHDGFEVHLRKGDRNNPNDPNYPNDPFPGTVEYPEYSLDPGDERSIWFRELDHKLFAKGTEIVVRDIFIQIDGGPIRRLPDSNEFYQSTEESCVDLMTRGEPPAYRIDFPEQSGYCLGRCAQPNVINSM